ncbi:hypothetical protein KY345_01680 [Candidatus Woesearchaeota archaeon]|nr:hypothetical protein [Candidatus Woesearchaeota archaeon]
MNIDIIKNSFRNVKRDFDVLRISFADWIHFLNNNQSQMQKKIEALEKRVNELESKEVITVY